MKRFRYAALGLVAGLFLVVPQEVDAQTGDGWWTWALRDVTEIADIRAGDRDRSRDEARRDGRTIGDIILGRGGQRDDRSRREADRDRDDRRERARRGGSDDRADRRGPPFCRNGNGHPVHGRQWCRDRGFDRASTRASTRWEDRGWEDIILRQPRGTNRQGTLDQGGLIDVLGDVVFGRLDGERRRLGGSASLDGRWLTLPEGARVLQVRSGAVPVAELSDVDGDGRVDVTLVPRR